MRGLTNLQDISFRSSSQRRSRFQDKFRQFWDAMCQLPLTSLRVETITLNCQALLQLPASLQKLSLCAHPEQGQTADEQGLLCLEHLTRLSVLSFDCEGRTRTAAVSLILPERVTEVSFSWPVWSTCLYLMLTLARPRPLSCPLSRT